MKLPLGRILPYAILLALWEVAGDLGWVGQGALPSPSGIARQFWLDRTIYPPHILATCRPALLGFLAGNLVAILAAIGFSLWPTLERLMRGINISVFAIPALALSPLLVIAFRGTTPQIVLAAISVYFPTMVATLVGLREIDPRPVEIVRTYGGGAWEIMRWVRLRSALPGLLSGLRVAAPASVLGAILAEFGSGSRWGLGSFLLGSMGQANPARLWGIGLTATALAATGYGLFSWLGGRLAGGTQSVTMAAGGTPDDISSAGTGRGRIAAAMLALGAFLMPFLAWWGMLRCLAISPVVARGPLATWTYLVTGPVSARARGRLADALMQSLPVAGLGLLLGLAAAFALAVLVTVRPRLGQSLLPAALLLQTMPLVALTPLIVLVLGRDLSATLAITVAVTFFPAFVTIAQGLATVPRSALDVLNVYGASARQSLQFVSIPMAMPYLCAAARLAAPRALLGVMIAEWLATGLGLGNLLNEARGRLDYGMIWAVAFVAVSVSVAFYQAVHAVEGRLRRRYGGA